MPLTTKILLLRAFDSFFLSCGAMVWWRAFEIRLISASSVACHFMNVFRATKFPLCILLVLIVEGLGEHSKFVIILIIT